MHRHKFLQDHSLMQTRPPTFPICKIIKRPLFETEIFWKLKIDLVDIIKTLYKIPFYT